MKSPPTETPTSVLEFETDRVLAAEDDRPADRPGSDWLLESISTHGQIVPGMVCPHPDRPGYYLVLDGVGRLDCCRRLDKTFLAILLPCPLDVPQRIQRRMQCNAIRRNLTQDEIAADAILYMRLTGATQEVAARDLTLSPATVSRAVNTQRRIPAELKDKADKLRPSIAWMIGTLKSPEAMARALEFAGTPGPDGKLPTREAVARYLKQINGTKERGPKPKSLRGKIDGRKVELAVVSGESTESLIKFLNGLIARLTKHKEVPAENLGFLFQN